MRLKVRAVLLELSHNPGGLTAGQRGEDDRRLPASVGVERMVPPTRSACVLRGRVVGLLADRDHVRDLHDTRLESLGLESPEPGWSASRTGVCDADHLQPRSVQHQPPRGTRRSLPAATAWKTPPDRRGGRAWPSSRMKTSGCEEVVAKYMPPEERALRERAGRIQAETPIVRFCSRTCRISAEIRLDLPTPGGPGPDRVRLPRVRIDVAHEVVRHRVGVLDEETHALARACRRRGRPPRATPASSPASEATLRGLGAAGCSAALSAPRVGRTRRVTREQARRRRRRDPARPTIIKGPAMTEAESVDRRS